MWFGVLCLLTVVILKLLFDYNRPVKFPPGIIKLYQILIFYIFYFANKLDNYQHAIFKVHEVYRLLEMY